MCSSGSSRWLSNSVFGVRDIKHCEKTGRGALYSAAEKGRTKIVSLLLSLGHSPDRQDVYGITPLQIAAWHGHCTVVRRLAEKSADVNKADRVGHSALFKAIWQGCGECAEILVKHGADCNLQDKLGETPLMLEAALGCVRLIPQLLVYGAKTNIQNLRGDTALHIAVCDGNMDFCRILLEHGANPDIRNMDGCTPVFYAVCRKYRLGAIECLKMFIRARADLDIKGREMTLAYGLMITPFECAILLNHPIGMLMLARANCSLKCLLKWMNSSDLPEVFSENPGLWPYFRTLLTRPPCLRQLCRNVIRTNVKKLDDLMELELPLSLASYIMYADLDDISMNDIVSDDP